MTVKLFTAAQFTATKWDTAEEKAAFANWLADFIASDFPQTKFTKKRYTRLSMTFGHIAHYDIGGFWGTFFESYQNKCQFIDITLRGGGYGDPAWTYCDVERAIQAWLLSSKWPRHYHELAASTAKAGRRAAYEALRAEFEDAA